MSQSIASGQLWIRDIDEVYEILQEVFGDETAIEIIELDQHWDDKAVEFIKEELKTSTQLNSTIVIDDNEDDVEQTIEDDDDIIEIEIEEEDKFLNKVYNLFEENERILNIL